MRSHRSRGAPHLRAALTSTIGFLITVSPFLFVGVQANSPVASPHQCPQLADADAASPSGRAGSRIIELPTDPDTVRALQKAFDGGHQPWRGDATWVAASAVAEAVGTGSAVESSATLPSKLVVECETPSESVVVVRDTSNEYRVYLKRLLPPQRGRPSAWTAIRVAVTPLN